MEGCLNKEACLNKMCVSGEKIEIEIYFRI